MTTRSLCWGLVAAACWIAVGCGSPASRKVDPRTPTEAEVREAERASRAAEADEHEAFAPPKPAAGKR
jgi:hypothetical protein